MDNFILKNSCMSADACQKYIDLIDNNLHKAVRGSLGPEPMDDIELNINVYEHPDLRKVVEDTLQKYVDKYPLLKTNVVPYIVDGSAQLMKYEPNNYCHQLHLESWGEERVLAWMIYLNTIKKGGGTEFIYLDTTAQPIAGDMYMWAAGFPYFHRGVVAPEETKYIITGWISNLREYVKRYPEEFYISMAHRITP
jgi:hypothetical protein